MQKMLTLILLSFFMFSCNKQDLTPTGTTVTTPQNTKITFGESKLLDSSLKEASGLAVDPFPPSDAQMHFDIEGFIATSEYFYLFTKDRSDPFTGITKLYQLPNEEGTFEAKLLDVYTTGGNDKSGAITGATFNEDTSLLVLLSEQKLFLFRNFDIPNFFDGTVEIVDLPYERKFEGISFADDCTLLLVNEKKYGEDAQLLEISICD